MKASVAAMWAATAVAALACGSVVAQSTTRTLDDVLTQDEGLTQISDGLYAQTTSSGESFVAVNKAGQDALRKKLLELRAKLTSGASASKNETASLDVIDKSIAELSQPQAKNQTVIGDCTGTGGTGQPQLYARALSSGGTTASGYAVLTSDFSPVTSTTNKASAGTANRTGDETSSQSSTQYGATAASASATAPNMAQACTASAAASVTCPGHSSPSISAFAYSQKPVSGGTCLL